MKRFGSALVTVAMLMLPVVGISQSLAPTPAYSPDRPLRKVATLLMTWHDEKRDRDVPVKIYYPADAKSACPMIIFSHGLGGNRATYSYLGKDWAGHGYISVHLQHLGSDDAVWRGAGFDGFAQLKQSVADPRNAINRALDVSFAIDQMIGLNHKAGPLEGLVDENEIGMAGHSFGAWTTLAVVGEKNPAGVSFTDAASKRPSP